MATNTILGLGVGLFNAALGKNYLSELANAESSGMSLLQIADVLDGIPQFTIDVMGGKTAEQQVDQFLSHYGITTGTAQTTAKAFVGNMLSSGKGFGAIAVAANDYLLGSSVAADFQPAATLLKNKIAVATAYSKTYSSESVATLQGVLAGVTPDMDTAAEIDAYLTGIGFPPGVLLTEQADIVTGHVFIAPKGFTPGGTDQINTLNDDDRLTGTSATDDRLEFDFVNDADTGDNNIAPTMSGVEIANIKFATDSDATLDLQDSTGFTHLNLHRIDDENLARIDNIQEATTNNLSINDSNSPFSDVEFTYLGSALAGTTDVVNLALNNAQVSDVFIAENRDNPAEGFETVNITSGGGAANSMVSLSAEDVQTLTIAGDQDLSIFGTEDIISEVGDNILVEGTATTGGLVRMAGSLTKIDASTLTGNLSINLNDVLQATKDGTSGTDVAVEVIGGTGDDTFWLGNGIGSNDTIDGGDGGNIAILTGGSIDGNINKTGKLEVRTNTTDDVEIDTSKLPDLTDILVRNEGNNGNVAPNPFEATNKAVDVVLNNVTETVAQNGIDILHGTTENNHIDDLDLTVDLATDGTDDSVVYTIAEGVNRDPRFSFTLNSEDFETVTIEDNDSESNSVEMGGTLPETLLTITDGEAGDFINFDIDTAGADVTNVITGIEADNGEVQQGLLGIDTDGSETDFEAGNIFDVEGLATQVRQVAATIDASAELANVIIRVSTNENSVDGAQSITMGKGDDTVIFDMLNDSRAGLTISDTVAGGDGDDTLVIDGHDTRVSLGASEWTNVTGFETVRLVGNNAAPVSTLIGQNSYNLTLTNDLIDANGGDMIHVINDNDVNNDEEDEVDTATTGTEFGVTLDARTLNAQNHFSYNGEEGASRTTDKFILGDANVNGANVIDGGAVDNDGDTTFAANDDILEVRNTATVTTGDLANVRNVGIIAGSNDQATEQTLILQLNDTVIDALVDSYHASSTTEVETLSVRLNDATDVTAVAGMGIDLDTTGTTAKSAVTVFLDTVVAAGAVDTLKVGFGLLTVGDVLVGVDGAFESTVDTVQLSVSKFGLTDDADDIGTTATLDTGADGTNILYGAAAAAAATDRIIIDTVTNTGVSTEIYYDPDGTGAQSQILIATIANNGTDLAATDFLIVA
ncbi:MAG: hypothetical protein IPJ05_10810 [Nitrosomonas sp.]|nr:hypothetical protein [Nitrosomonas sp.]